jgi:hypothetical protein
MKDVACAAGIDSIYLLGRAGSNTVVIIQPEAPLLACRYPDPAAAFPTGNPQPLG